MRISPRQASLPVPVPVRGADTFVRPGQLFGGPYDNNYYLGTLFQLDKDAETREVRAIRPPFHV